jgi:prephenate dehydrogenase
MDMTRVARLNEHMWTELFIENSEYLADEIDGMIERLKYFSDIIKSKSKSELIETLKQGSDRKKFLTGEEL